MYMYSLKEDNVYNSDRGDDDYLGGGIEGGVCTSIASSPGLQLCGGKAWYRLHAHARAFCKICRIRIRTDIVGLYVYGQFYGKVYGNLAHAHAVDTRPSLRIIEGLGTRLAPAQTQPPTDTATMSSDYVWVGGSLGGRRDRVDGGYRCEARQMGY